MVELSQNKAVIRQFTEHLNARDYDGLSRIVSPSFERHCPATPDVEVRSFQDFRVFLEQDLVTFPDSRITLETLVAEGDQVAFWATYAATQEGPMGPFPASGRRARLEFSGVFRLSRGKVTDVRVTWDNMDLLRQLGHLEVGSRA